MSYRRLVLLLAVVCAACKPAPPQPAKPPAVPTVRATVVTIRTTIQPGNRTLTHLLVIRGDSARSTDEHDTWRLFDVKEKTVTFVDDIARTTRTEPLAALAKRDASRLPGHYPAARLVQRDARRVLQGVPARPSVIESGAYRRELWLAEHPSIPRGLFAMMYVARPASSPLAPMMRSVDEALAKTEGFPLLDRAEVAYGAKKMVIERAVVSIAQRDVPQTLLSAPPGYRDLTKPAASRRSAS